MLGAGNVSNNGSGSPSQGAGRRFPSSPSSPGAAGGGRRAWLPTSPDSPSGPGGLSGERVLVPLSGGRGEREKRRREREVVELVAKVFMLCFNVNDIVIFTVWH